MVWLHEKSAGVCLLWFGLVPQLVLGSPLALHKRTTPCDEILDIVDSYGTLEGTLGGAQILIPSLSSSEAGTVIRQFMTFLDTATLNVYALFDAIPGCTRPQPPPWDGSEEEFESINKRQGSTAICASLKKVSADVTQAVAFMSRLLNARGLPSQLYLDPLQEAVDDAKARIFIIEAALKASNGC